MNFGTLGTGFGGMGRGGAGVVFEPEALTLFAAMSSQPDNTRKALINTVIAALKTAGIWTSLDVFYALAAHDSQAALLNWKNPATFTAAEVNSPTFTTDRGYAGNGSTSYLNTGFNPSTAGGNYTQNAASLGGFIQAANGAAANSNVWGYWDGTDGSSLSVPSVGNVVSARINQGPATTLSPYTSPVGFWAANRSASGATQFYLDGTALTPASNANQGSTGLNNDTIKIGAISGSFFSAARVGLIFIGGNMGTTAHAALSSAVSSYMTAVGAK